TEIKENSLPVRSFSASSACSFYPSRSFKKHSAVQKRKASKTTIMKRNAFIAGVGGVMAIAITAPAFVSGEEDRTEPGDYQERDVLLELSEYTEDVERGAIDVPDEQHLLEFDQPLEDDYDDIEQALFSDSETPIVTAESVA